MEMPEGWKRLYEKSDPKVYLGMTKTTREALNLMKEMAEALDYCAKHLPEDHGQDLVPIKVLEKFREWK